MRQADEQPSEDAPNNRSSRSLCDKVINITDHGTIGQVVGGLILAALLAGVGALWASFHGYNLGGDSGESSSAPGGATFSGPMDLSEAGYKDIDLLLPGNVSTGAGSADVTLDGSGYTIKGTPGTKIAHYSGTGSPSAKQCSQAAQVNGEVTLHTWEGRWVCVRSQQGSVAAFRVSSVDTPAFAPRVMHGQAIVWRHR